MNQSRFMSALREAIHRSAMTEEEVASLLGVRQNTVARWKGGSRMPSGLMWQALRDKLPHFAELVDAAEADGKAVA